MGVFALKHLFFVIFSGLLWMMYIPTAAALTQNEVQKLLASDAAASGSFGDSVSVDGNTAVIGARSGSVYVFTRNGSTWTEQAKLSASNAAAFGWSVSVDGNTAVIGARSDSVYVFTRNGSTWTEQAKLTASDAAANDEFGDSVSVDGDTVVIGAPGNDDAGFSSGSAYVFTRNGSTWTEQAKLTASDAAAFDLFGFSVSVDDEDTAVIGAANGDNAGTKSGSAYMFTRNGSTWTEQAKLSASDAAAGDFFGDSVSVDRDTVIIGAANDDNDDTNSGSAYVFTRSGSTWTEQAKLTASDAAYAGNFGNSVSLDGNTAVIGTSNDDDAGTKSGSAYVFTRNGSTWTEQAKLTASDAAAEDFFGDSVSVDGDTAVIGALGDDDAGDRSGSVYIFTLTGPDTDDDGVPDADDNCPDDFNSDQADFDDDLLGDVCDTDDDNDTILDDVDNCPLDPNPDQLNNDGDSLGDACDDDDDNDGVLDDAPDNCPFDPNPSQADFDGDSIGDVCDDDSDSDGVTDTDDQCLLTEPDAITDATGCSIAQLCPADGGWRNHGAYVRCVARSSEDFLDAGLITEDEKDAIVSEAGKSDIGKKRK